MNYFELYPGDYLKDTGRLTLLDHGAYLRLMLEYYATEEPLPADHAELFVIVAAVSSAEKAAVRKVADRYFPVGADGLRRNARADAEIAKAQRRINTARQNGSKGGRKTEPSGNPAGSETGTQWDTQRDTQRDTRRGTQPGTHSGEALQTPHAIQPIGYSSHAECSDSARAGTDAGLACRLMREAGCLTTNPSHPKLAEVLSAGGTPQALADTVREGLARNPPVSEPFRWALSTLLGRLAESRTPGAPHAPRPQAGRVSLADQSAAAAAERRRAAGPALDVIDGTATRLAG